MMELWLLLGMQGEWRGVKSSTVNRSLAVVRIILNLCAKSWRDEYGLTWLKQSP